MLCSVLPLEVLVSIVAVLLSFRFSRISFCIVFVLFSLTYIVLNFLTLLLRQLTRLGPFSASRVLDMGQNRRRVFTKRLLQNQQKCPVNLCKTNLATEHGAVPSPCFIEALSGAFNKLCSRLS